MDDDLFDMMYTEPTLNKHQIAWYSNDDALIKECASEFDIKDTENKFFGILNAINYDKTPLNVDTYIGTGYSKWQIDSYMMQFPDTLHIAYVMNMMGSDISNQDHFDYYLNAVERNKRYGAKKGKYNEDLERIVIVHQLCDIYKLNRNDGEYYYDEYCVMGIMDDFKHKYKSIMISTTIHKTNIPKGEKNKIIKIMEKW